jgi:hypothetical protein
MIFDGQRKEFLRAHFARSCELCALRFAPDDRDQAVISTLFVEAVDVEDWPASAPVFADPAFPVGLAP